MKKLGLIVIIALLAAGAVTAQNWRGFGVSPQPTAFEGTLQLLNGQIALSTGNTVFFVPVLRQYVGFIEELREGARISILGYASGNTLQPIQFTIAGRSYDLSPVTSVPAGFGQNGFASCCADWQGYGRGRCW